MAYFLNFADSLSASDSRRQPSSWADDMEKQEKTVKTVSKNTWNKVSVPSSVNLTDIFLEQERDKKNQFVAVQSRSKPISSGKPEVRVVVIPSGSIQPSTVVLESVPMFKTVKTITNQKPRAIKTLPPQKSVASKNRFSSFG